MKNLNILPNQCGFSIIHKAEQRVTVESDPDNRKKIDKHLLIFIKDFLIRVY